MKKLIILSLLTATLFGCSSDDPKTTIDGNWNLVKVEGGLMGINDTFAPGEIKWRFNEDGQTMTVTNNNDNDEKEDMLVTGDYTYEIVANVEGAACAKNIVIDEFVDFGCYSLQGQRLKIGSVNDDGYLLTLER